MDSQHELKTFQFISVRQSDDLLDFDPLNNSRQSLSKPVSAHPRCQTIELAPLLAGTLYESSVDDETMSFHVSVEDMFSKTQDETWQ